MITIKNDNLLVEISELGAEVRAVINIATEHEYMWSGDGRIWAGVSPVLFPVVGKSHDNKIKYQGKEYPMVITDLLVILYLILFYIVKIVSS